jgi:uncharacterized membrane protein YfcA
MPVILNFDAGTLGLLIAGAIAGGFVNGLTGFGTGLSAMPFWLHAVPPPLAAQLVASASVAGQLSTLSAIWHAIDWRRVAPMLIAGLIGVPIGTMLLPYIDLQSFKRGVGLILVVYASIMLAAGTRLKVRGGGRGVEILLGFASGILGGLAGLSGVLLTIWSALKSWTKEERRSIFQAFNLTILAATVIAHVARGLIDPRLLGALVLALPGTFLGVALGQYVYARLDDHRFDRVVLILLLLAGLSLLAFTR